MVRVALASHTHGWLPARWVSGWLSCEVMGDWADQVIADDENRQRFLLDWQDEIRAVKRYGQVPVHPHDLTIAPEYVVAGLGPALTAMARAAARLERLGRGTQRHHDNPAHPDVQVGINVAWGARQALAVGLGVQLNLSFQHATWLADALAGYETEIAAQAREWKSGRDHHGHRPGGSGEVHPDPA